MKTAAVTKEKPLWGSMVEWILEFSQTERGARVPGSAIILVLVMRPTLFDVMMVLETRIQKGCDACMRLNPILLKFALAKLA